MCLIFTVSTEYMHQLTPSSSSSSDISQHTKRGLGDWQDVYQWSASGHGKHLQTRQDPKAAPPHDPDQLGNGESTEPEI